MPHTDFSRVTIMNSTAQGSQRLEAPLSRPTLKPCELLKFLFLIAGLGEHTYQLSIVECNCPADEARYVFQTCSCLRGRLNREPSTLLFPQISALKGSSYREAMDSRPPLVINVDSPGPAAYSPPTMSCRESSAPAYTFGRKTPPREGGGRRSWQKSWFQSKSPFTRKADFNTERNWPSPFHYTQPSTLGPRQASRPGYPSYSIGRKGKFSLVSKDAQINPAPNKYDTTPAYFQVLQTSPSYSIRNRPQGTHQWDSSGNTPGPGLYDVEKGHIACLPSSPSVIIQGIRRPKRHETGPFTTL